MSYSGQQKLAFSYIWYRFGAWYRSVAAMMLILGLNDKRSSPLRNFYGVVYFGRMRTPKAHYHLQLVVVQQRQFSFWQHVKFRFWQLLVVWLSVLCLFHVSLIWCLTLCFFSGRSYFSSLFWLDAWWQEMGLICWLLQVTQWITKGI